MTGDREVMEVDDVMGQLEKYGLFVLCVVIVLILGVAIWGEEPRAAGPLDARDTAAGQRREPDPEAFFEPRRERGVGGLEEVDLDDVGDDLPDGHELVIDASSGGRRSDTTEPAPRTHRIIRARQNDSWWSIAQRELGAGHRYEEVKALNPGRTDLIHPDDEIRVPLSRTVRTSPDPETPADVVGVHVVRKGEVISMISQKHYGTSRHWQKILRYNGIPIEDAPRLQAGTRLRLPMIAATD